MIAAILHLSYNPQSDTTSNIDAVGSTRGTAFLVGNQTLLTAHHVLNPKVIREKDKGYKYSGCWILVHEGVAVPITQDMVSYYPQIDTTVIKLKGPVPGLKNWQWSSRPPSAPDKVYSLGYEAGEISPPQISVWDEGKLSMYGYDLSPFAGRARGVITRIWPVSAESKEAGLETKLTNIKCIQTTCGGGKGMSGGPLIDSDTDTVIGLTSFGTDKYFALGQGTFFIHKDEILKRIGLTKSAAPPPRPAR